jgi:hypothetical protein
MAHTDTWHCVSLALGILTFIIVALVVSIGCEPKHTWYDAHDIHEAHKAMHQLTEMQAAGQEPPQIDERDLDRLAPKIHLAMIKSEPVVDAAKEGYDSYQFPRWPPATIKSLYLAGLPIDRYYTNWPPYVFDRLFEWQPGFQTSGFSSWLRPMNVYGRQAFWTKNNGNYFYIRN